MGTALPAEAPRTLDRGAWRGPSRRGAAVPQPCAACLREAPGISTGPPGPRPVLRVPKGKELGEKVEAKAQPR